MGKRAQKAAPPPTKVVIAASGYGEVKAEFCFSLVMAVKRMTCAIKLDYEASCYVHRNRNVLLERALAGDATHLMFIDTDIAFPPDGIEQLLAARKPVIGGAYNLKRLPEDRDGKKVATTTVKALPRDIVNGQWTMDKSKPFECRALPTGFMLIELDALRNMPDPPAHTGNRVGDGDAGPRGWFAFDNYAGFVGEDVYFCDYIRERGVPIWCDPTIKLGHVGSHVF